MIEAYSAGIETKPRINQDAVYRFFGVRMCCIWYGQQRFITIRNDNVLTHDK